MAQIKAIFVKELRERTGAGMMDCKKALVETEGDMDKAMELLQKRAAAKAVKRMDREASEGRVASYIHGLGRIGVMVEINCETDFVARNDDFATFVHDVALHIAAAQPKFVSVDGIPAEEKARQEAIFSAQAAESGRPEKIIPKIVEGKIKKWAVEACLLEQPWFRDSDKTVQDVLTALIAKLGENVRIRRFVRWQLGERL